MTNSAGPSTPAIFIKLAGMRAADVAKRTGAAILPAASGGIRLPSSSMASGVNAFCAPCFIASKTEDCFGCEAKCEL